jgi:hypothetical protein
MNGLATAGLWEPEAVMSGVINGIELDPTADRKGSG